MGIAATSPENGKAGPLSRRRFLSLVGVAASSVAVGAASKRVLERVSADQLPTAAKAAATTTRQWVMVFDLRRCDGCRRCIKACHKMHQLGPAQDWLSVYEQKDATGQSAFLPVPCQLCQNAPCVQVCPVGASYYTRDRVIVVDQDACIGCRMCMAACPYGVRVFNWSPPPDVPAMLRTSLPEFRIPQKQGTVGKCSNCVHNLRDAKLPACLDACAMEAIWAGDLNDDVATNGHDVVVLSRFLRDNDVYRLKEELGTQPHVFYIAGHGQSLEY